MGGNPDDYTYLELRDAMQSVNQKVNLLAVVIEFGMPKKSKGTDYVCILKIMDESFQAPGLTVNFFAQDKANLPRVMSAGDIILLDRVLMKLHNKDVFALFNKKFSSFALFEGKSGTDFIPYQAYKQLRIKDCDKKFIAKLRSWLGDYEFESGTREYLLQFRELKDGSYCDLVCKVLHIHEISEDESIFFVWDGSDTPPAPASIQMNQDLEAEKPLPLQLEPFSLPRDVLCTFPRVGTVLRVTVGKLFKEHWDWVQLRGRQQWVKFRNVLCQLQSGLWQGVMMPSSKIFPLSEKDNNVISWQRYYNERVSSESECMPTFSFPWPSRITVTDYEDASFSTLMEILTHPQVTYEFKCIVRVVETYPRQAKDFRSTVGAHPYRVRLTLEDPTARIHAYVYAHDGVKFFEGYPPADVLSSKMNKLLGISESGAGGDYGATNPRNAPWVQCCIKSYYLDKSNPWETRRYRIFGTTLVG